MRRHIPCVWVAGQGFCTPNDIPTTLQSLHAIARHCGWAPAVQAILPMENPMYTDTSSRLIRLGGPAAEPLTLAEAKQFLRIEHSADDAVIARAIIAAREAAEEFMRTIMLAQQFSYATALAGTIVTLPVGPAQTVNQVQLVTSDGNMSIAAPESYRLTIDGYALVFNHIPQAVKLVIQYEAYSATTAANLPSLMKQGMLHHLAALVQERDTFVPLPKQAMQCYQPFRRVRL